MRCMVKFKIVSYLVISIPSGTRVVALHKKEKQSSMAIVIAPKRRRLLDVPRGIVINIL